MESGSTKERKKDDGAPPERGHVIVPRNSKNAVNLEDYGVFAVNEDEFRLRLLPDDIQNAIDFPTAGWPTYQTLYGCDPPVPLFYEQSQIAGLDEADPLTDQNRPAGRDIVIRALEQAGAKRAEPAQWLMMSEKGDVCAPMVVLDYVAYRFPTRFVRGH